MGISLCSDFKKSVHVKLILVQDIYYTLVIRGCYVPRALGNPVDAWLVFLEVCT